MTTRHKDFGSVETVQDQPPVTFTLDGETFTARGSVQGATLLKFVKEADSGDGGRAASSLLGFFKIVLEPESYTRFEAVTEDPDKVITIEQLTEIAGWLMEVYTDRPTRGPSS